MMVASRRRIRALSIDVLVTYRLNRSAVIQLADTRGEGDTGYLSNGRASARLTIIIEEETKHRQRNAN